MNFSADSTETSLVFCVSPAHEKFSFASCVKELKARKRSQDGKGRVCRGPSLQGPLMQGQPAYKRRNYNLNNKMLMSMGMHGFADVQNIFPF